MQPRCCRLITEGPVIIQLYVVLHHFICSSYCTNTSRGHCWIAGVNVLVPGGSALRWLLHSRVHEFLVVPKCLDGEVECYEPFSSLNVLGNYYRGHLCWVYFCGLWVSLVCDACIWCSARRRVYCTLFLKWLVYRDRFFLQFKILWWPHVMFHYIIYNLLYPNSFYV